MSKLLLMMIAILTVGASTVEVMAAPLQSHDGRNRRVRIHNQTGWTMVKFQAAEAQSRAWQGDAMGSQPVATGASWVATIDDGAGACVYAFRAEFSNGQTLERDAINVCEIADYYYTR